MRRGQHRALTADSLDQMRDATEEAKARVRVRGEHAFHAIKNLFGYRKVRYRGIAKHEVQLYTLFVSAKKSTPVPRSEPPSQ